MGQKTRREFLENSLGVAAAAAATPFALGGSSAFAQDAPIASPISEKIRVGVIGVRGRGRAHVSEFIKSPDSEVVAICDADEAVIGGAMKAAPDARYYKDMRKMLDDPSIHAVSIATPNHWHSLATLWALQAGKHVYVEKPLSHTLHEGRCVVAMAQKTGGIVQHGTQARSLQATRDAIEWLHSGALGKIKVARALCYKRRKTIGKVDGPQTPPATCDYNLWTGPATMEPLMRTNLHYDWHWVFNTGNGDMGNQGVHQMDIARWGLGRSDLPQRVMSMGGRLGYDDDGNTPNTQVSVFDYGDQKLVFEVRGLETKPYHGTNIGVIFHCEQGTLVSKSYTRLHAYDLDGNQIAEFNGGGNHVQSFLDACKAGDPGKVTADAHEGHLSSALCHLGNVSYKLGASQALGASDAPFGDDEVANESFARCRQHLADNGVDPQAAAASIGPRLDFDPKTERFTGEHALAANALLVRPGRGEFMIPDVTAGVEQGANSSSASSSG